MKKRLLTLFTVMLVTGYCMAQEMTVKTSRSAGQRIQLNITSDGGFTIEGVEEESNEGFSGYTLTGSEIKLIGNITSFSSPYNEITAVDVTGMPCIKELDIFGNPINNLSLKNNTELTFLGIGATEITSVDLSSCPNLETLNANNGKLETLDLSHNKDIKNVLANNAGISTLILQGADNLDILDCSNNKFNSLDITPVKKLTQLACAGCNLNTLDITNHKLVVLNCNANNLKELDLSNQSELQELGCTNNKLEKIDLSDCHQLFALRINNNIILDKNMTTLVNSLPIQGEEPLNGNMVVVDTKSTNERNEMTTINVENAMAKNWYVFDLAGGNTGEDYGIPYDGISSDMVSVDNINVIKLNVYKSVCGMLYIKGAAGKNIVINDIHGREVHKIHALEELTIIDVNNIPAGVYIVTIGKESVKIRF